MKIFKIKKCENCNSMQKFDCDNSCTTCGCIEVSEELVVQATNDKAHDHTSIQRIGHCKSCNISKRLSDTGYCEPCDEKDKKYEGKWTKASQRVWEDKEFAETVFLAIDTLSKRKLFCLVYDRLDLMEKHHPKLVALS